MIAKEDLIKGMSYIAKYNSDDFLMIYDGNHNCYSDYIYKKKEFLNNGNFRFKEDCSVSREATHKEILWLECCIEQGKFIPFNRIPIKPKVKFNSKHLEKLLKMLNIN